MNKKISTLFTASLLFSSVFGSSAWAQDILRVGSIADELENGKYYHLVMNTDDKNDGTETPEKALGFTEHSLQQNVLTVSAINVSTTSATSEDVDVDAYLWSVQEVNVSLTSTPKYALILTNKATGEELRFDSNFDVETSTTEADKNKATNKIVWGPNWRQYAADGTPLSRKVYVAAELEGNTSALPIGINSSNKLTHFANASNTKTFSIREAADESVSDSELNDLYNSTGFNFTLGDDYADVENIFDQEGQKVYAIQVKYNVYPSNEYDGGVSGNNYFPAGTYFAVRIPSGPVPTQTSNRDEAENTAMYNFLMDCEFIAVNPNDNKSDVAATRKSGEGFALTTISARSQQFNLFAQTNKDIIAENEDKLPSGNEISVWNACFDVKKNASNSNKYAIALTHFYVNETADAASQIMKDNHDLTIKSGTGYGASEYLVTANVTGYDYKFQFVESNAVAGTHFLNADGPAIYNIRFVSGDQSDDESEYGKYLFAPAYTDALYAKGSVLTDENMPEFQFVITEVQGTQVTFANRANDAVKFTVQLFDEGNGEYSLGYSKGTSSYTILDVQDNGDIDAVSPVANLQLSQVVLETPESTDKFNGTWNVDDATKVTIAFARDNTPTSNKVYPTAKYTSSPKDFVFGTNTSDVAEAAQWQLNKTEKPSYITRTYAFRVGEGDKATVDYQIDGDTIAYYTYNMQLIVDGDVVKDEYFDISGSGDGAINEYDQKFIIKDNVDESVSLIVVDDNATAKSGYATNSQVVIDNHTVTKNDISDYLKSGIGFGSAALTQKPEAKYIKSYLLEEAPERSWTESGHITLQSEKGNYISMEEDSRDAVVVNNDNEVLYLHMTDEDAVVPSFYISKGIGNDGLGERMFLFNPEDSIDYYVADGVYNREYQFSADYKKALFKAGTLDASCDTMTTDIKGKVATIAAKADNNGTQGGLNRFKFQIVETEDGDGYYYIRQLSANDKELTASNYASAKNYLISHNESLSWGKKAEAMLFAIEGVEAPTTNEAISATDVKVVAYDGAINIKNAAGKNVVVSTILGQIVANEVLTSDNATISVPAGIAIVSVDGEEAVKVSVR